MRLSTHSVRRTCIGRQPCNSNHAVGMWDIMAMNSGSRLMRPLFITLQDCGWAEIEEVEPGTHTFECAFCVGALGSEVQIALF